jgi:hypothetical protein
VWVIDIKRSAMTVYSKQNDPVIRRAVDSDYRSEALDANFSLADIFE